MMEFLEVYAHLIEMTLISAGLAMAQFLTLRAGMFTLSIIGFFVLGAYAAALLVMRLAVPVYPALLAAALLSLAIGWLFSLVLDRLRGHFLGLATLGFTSLVIVVALNWEDLTYGVMGLNRIPKSVSWWEILIYLAVVTYVAHVMTHGRMGRAFMAIRENETSASSSGVNVLAFRQLAFIVSSVMAGLAGGFYGFVSRALVPTEFGFSRVTDVLVMTILGGTPHWAGPILGSVVLTTMPEWLRGFSTYRLLVSGLVLTVVIIYLPGGLISLGGKLADLIGRRARREPSTPVGPAPAASTETGGEVA